jgi:tetratricopeptide (TPR) repeat protein
LAARVHALSAELAAHVAVDAVGDAVRAADALLGLDDTALTAADPATVRELLGAAEALAATGELDWVEQLLTKGVNALSSNPQATPVDLVVPLNNLMAVYDQQGNGPMRDRVAGMIGSLAVQLDEPIPRNAATVFLQLGRIYEDQGNVNAALVLYWQVHRYMVTLRESDPDMLTDWLRRYVGVLQAGDHQDAVIEVCRQAVSTMEGVPRSQRPGAVEFLVALAAAATAKGDQPTAEEALEEAVRTAEESTGGPRPAEPGDLAAASAAYHNLAVLYLGQDRADRYPRAEQLAQRALAIVLQLGREGSAEHAGELGQLGVIADRRGDAEAAERYYVAAVGVYEQAPDTVPEELADFLIDLGRLRLERGRPAEAVAPLQRAAELREGSAVESPSRRADALSDLATAAFEAGDLESATLHYGKAVDLRLGAAT